MIMPRMFCLQDLSYFRTVYNFDVCFSGYEVKEALRAQMEVQSKLHLQVEVKFSSLKLKWK